MFTDSLNKVWQSEFGHPRQVGKLSIVSLTPSDPLGSSV